MMRFNFVLLLATICSDVLAEDGTGCQDSYTYNGFLNTRCFNDYVTRVLIVMSETQIEVVCREESAWSDFNYYTPIPSDHWNIDVVSIRGCSWPDAWLRGNFRTVLKIKARSFTWTYGAKFGQSLSKFDLNELADVRELTLSHNDLSELAVDLFEDFEYLHKLDLSSNNIRDLNSKMFSHVTTLKILDLSDNNLTSIDELLFQNLTRLKHLNLMKNHLTSLHANTFHGPTSLSFLNLADNRLGTLPKDLFVSLSDLTSLDISANQLSAINEAMFARNTKLNSVYLRNNRGSLSESLASLSFLFNWPKLEDLQLTSADLRNLPENIFRRNVYLGRLNLSENALETLRKDVFKGLTKLKILDISGNRMNNIHPDTFSPLVSLMELNLERNNLTTIHLIPASVQILNAAYNQILNVSEGFFYPTNKRLRVLRLSNNLLGTSTKNIDLLKYCLLATCKDLEEIYLDNNEIGTMSYEVLNRFTRLRVVDLSDNRLGEFQLVYEIIFPQSVMIDVSHNMIKYITVSPTAKLCSERQRYNPNNSIVRFGNNPIMCNCAIYDVLESQDSVRHPYAKLCYQIDLDNQICSDPPWMKGVPVLEIDYKKFTCRREADYSECPVDCKCWWRLDDITRLLNCSHKNLTKVPAFIGESRNSPIELNLTGNHLTEMPSLTDSGYEFVTKLFLSHNNISNVSVDVVSPKLKVLQLDHNNLTSFDAKTMNAIKQAKNLDNLTLFDNPWDCNRVTRDFLEYVSRTFSTRTTASPGKLCLDQPSDEKSSHRPRPRISFVRF